MSIADRLKKRVRSVINQLSGEYSAVAPDPATIKPAERPTHVDANIKVTRARLKRPGAAEDQLAENED